MRIYSRQKLNEVRCNKLWRMSNCLRPLTALMGLTFGFIVPFIVILQLDTTFNFLLSPHMRNIIAGEMVDFTDANNETGYPEYIVPNWVHFIKFRNDQLAFFEMVTIRAAHQIQKPERLIIHCDCTTLRGRYWDMLQDIEELEVIYMKEPKYIFGQPISHVYHASDVARIRVLMEYGGIFLDNDVYLIRNLDSFRKFEFALGLCNYNLMGTMVLIAHRNARLFKCWLEGYKRYNPKIWYYNAGELPTLDCIHKDPNIVHMENSLFGVLWLLEKLYRDPWPEWKEQYSVHLGIRHRYYADKDSPIKEFDEFNIRAYNQTWGEMARLTLFGSTDLLPEISSQTNITNPK